MLSVVVPVRDEIRTIGAVLAKIGAALPGVPKQIVVVDDHSGDGTREWLRRNVPSGFWEGTRLALSSCGDLWLEAGGTPMLSLEVAFHDGSMGKGGTLQTAFARVAGDIVVIQDADLEYDPGDWDVMYELIVTKGVADVVYGSRFAGRPRRSLSYLHFMANRVITAVFNVVCNQSLTDVETCYKMMTRDVLQTLRLTASDFGIEIEISAQIAQQRRLRLYEVGISYHGRTHADGKKIRWSDGLKALWYVVKFGLLGRIRRPIGR